MKKNVFILSILLFSFTNSISQQTTTEISPVDPDKTNPVTTGEKEIPIAIEKGVPVIFDGKILLRIYSSIGPFTAGDRAQAITNRLKKIKDLKSFNEDELQIIKSEFTTDIVYKSEIIMSITPVDCKEAEKEIEVMANEYYSIIKEFLKINPNYTIIDKPKDVLDMVISNKKTLMNIGIAFASFIFLLIFIYLNGRLFEKGIENLQYNKKEKLKDLSFKSHIFLSKESIITSISLLFKGIKFFFIFLFLYLYINLLFYLFPWSEYSGIKSIIWGLLLTIISIMIWYGLYKSVKVLFEVLHNTISKRENTFIQPLVIKNMTLLTESQIIILIKRISLFLQFVCNLFLVYIFIPIVFSYFDFSKDWADTLFGYVLNPLKKITTAFVHFLPNLIFIIIIVIVNRYISKLSKLFFNEIKKENIKISGFRSEWAEPTYKIVRFLIIVFTIIMVYPYLPGSDSEAFKGVSVLLGILFSLGSTSIIGNAVSGTILTYMYAFQEGDRVKIGDTVGDVIEKTLLVTRIKTVKNVIVSIPNSSVMSNHIINYSSSIIKENLILHTAITLGYDVPWRKVHATLIEAANRTGNVLKTPIPFVLQTSLDDYYVAYELNVYTDKPHIMSLIYSELHQNMQDTCNENGIEILSPRYDALRDGNQSTIPENYLPKSYEAPGFKVSTEKKE